MKRHFKLYAPILLLLLIGFTLFLIHNARAVPLVRQGDIALPFPNSVDHKPVRVALVTDTHLSGPDNSPERLSRIVEQINGLHPDLILLGGDYMGDWKGGQTYDAYSSIAPFGKLKAPLGVVAVLGNHDNHSDKNPTALSRPEWRKAFARLGVTMLDDEVVRKGPLSVGGLRDIHTGWPKVPKTMAALKADGGVPLLLSHSPDSLPMVPDQRLLMLAGHTHCGQVVLPLIGILVIPSRYGTRYSCGQYREGNRDLIVSSGVGTSKLPIRLRATPDIWLITIRPE